MLWRTVKIIFLVIITTILLVGCGRNLWREQKKSQVMAARSEAVASTKTEITNVVLMLPLKGELASNSQAIRNGFLAAYHQARKNHPEINIKVIDTADSDLYALYHQVVEGGADIVVGPLTKKEVEIIKNINQLPVPTIALNTLDDYSNNFAPNLYQFGLLPQDEATQVAKKMVEERHDMAAIIVPATAWGDKIATTFRDKYVADGGKVIAVLHYDARANLADQVCRLLAQDANKLCVPQKRRERGQYVSSATARRQDINTIFLVAMPNEARQIVPLLKFYYAGDLPIYSISAIFSGRSNPNLDQDIDGVYFCDMPWVLHDPNFLNDDLQAAYRKSMALWADSFAANIKLYALGVDAYNLAVRLNEFLNSPYSGIAGASGTLYLDNFNHVYRELQWAQVRDGIVTVLH